MAEKTVEASVQEQQQGAALEHRYRRIDQVRSMLTAPSCFRAEIRAYFGQAAGPRSRRLSERIIDWVFGARTPAIRRSGCCDYCDTIVLRRAGLPNYVATRLGSIK
jgi:hypothetical protein